MPGDLTVRRLTTEDAPALVRLIERCYGDTYPVASFYDAAELGDRVESGQMRSVVAVQDDRLVGHIAICVRHTDAIVCETGNTVVDPSVRGQGLLQQLGIALSELAIAEGFVGYVHYPTTAHHIMQRVSVSHGGTETGLMLAYMPAATNYRDIERSPGRVTVTVAYQPLTRGSERTILLPQRYRDILAGLYELLSLHRTFSASSTAETSPARIVAEHNRKQSALCLFNAGGANGLSSAVTEQLVQHQSTVTFIDLPLENQDIDAQVDILTQLGFCYSALLPDFARTDVLRLQLIRDFAPELFQIRLENDGARQLLRFIQSDAGALGSSTA